MAGGTSAGAGESGGRTLVYLARHGQTPLNESDVLRGLADPALDETGRDQARRLGAALGPLGLWAVLRTANLAEGKRVTLTCLWLYRPQVYG
jgi:bisphosphoglycerate-dependent phosphoglycerate mutase